MYAVPTCGSPVGEGAIRTRTCLPAVVMVRPCNTPCSRRQAMAVPAMTIDGDVVAVHSHWVSDGSRIVTEATVLTPDGTEVVVSQLGGSVDGIGQISWPGPAPLELGMRVAVAAHRDVDLEQREHVLLDSVKVLDYPPGYVRTGPTKAGKYLFWESGCVFVSVGAEGTTAIAGDAEFDIVQKSIDTWNNATHTPACSYL